MVKHATRQGSWMALLKKESHHSMTYVKTWLKCWSGEKKIKNFLTAAFDFCLLYVGPMVLKIISFGSFLWEKQKKKSLALGRRELRTLWFGENDKRWLRTIFGHPSKVDRTIRSSIQSQGSHGYLPSFSLVLSLSTWKCSVWTPRTLMFCHLNSS